MIFSEIGGCSLAFWAFLCLYSSWSFLFYSNSFSACIFLCITYTNAILFLIGQPIVVWEWLYA